MDIATNNELKERKIPNTFAEYWKLLSAVLRAVRNEPTLNVVNQSLYDELMKCDPRYIAAFFNRHNYEDEPDSYYVLIAKDKDGDLVSLGKDNDGLFIQVNMYLNCRERYIRFGSTYPMEGKRYDFYKTFDCYLDYHHSVNNDGYARRMRTRALGGWDTRWCDENGHSGIVTNVKGFWSELKHVFETLK